MRKTSDALRIPTGRTPAAVDARRFGSSGPVRPKSHAGGLGFGVTRPDEPERRSQTILDATFSALSDPTRRAILERLRTRSLTVSELARPFSMSLPAVSKHLRILEKAGLIIREKEGRTYQIRIDATTLVPAVGWIARYKPLWDRQFDALGTYLSELREGEGTPDRREH